MVAPLKPHEAFGWLGWVVSREGLHFSQSQNALLPVCFQLPLLK